MGVNIQHSRRTSKYPWTWEPAAAGLLVILVCMTVVVHVARSLANVWAGGPPDFASLSHWPRSTFDILAGDATTGLTPVPQSYATPAQLRVLLVVSETLLLCVLLLLTALILQRWGPGRIQGLASPKEARMLLGRSRLRKSARVVRPDLHGGHIRERFR